MCRFVIKNLFNVKTGGKHYDGKESDTNYRR